MQLDLVQGTLDMLILKALASGGKHGYAVARWLEQTTEDVLKVEEGSLYPALHRMEKRGWVQSEWGFSENNRRARYYSLTAEGKKQLGKERATWGVFVEAVAKVLSAPA